MYACVIYIYTSSQHDWLLWSVFRARLQPPASAPPSPPAPPALRSLGRGGHDRCGASPVAAKAAAGFPTWMGYGTSQQIKDHWWEQYSGICTSCTCTIMNENSSGYVFGWYQVISVGEKSSTKMWEYNMFVDDLLDLPGMIPGNTLGEIPSCELPGFVSTPYASWNCGIFMDNLPSY